MQKIILSGLSGMLATLLLAGCTSVTQNHDHKPVLGMVNPASQYCVSQGGKLELRTEAQGQVGYCHLKNQQVIEEWEYYNMSQPKCVPEQAVALVGQADLTEAQIKQKTQAQLVRVIHPGDVVTMDYNDARITVTVDAASKKVLQANCG